MIDLISAGSDVHPFDAAPAEISQACKLRVLYHSPEKSTGGRVLGRFLDSDPA